MPLFYESAFRAACRDRPPAEIDRLRPDHFLRWDRLFQALSWLSDEQRCDAIYGDWLCQLDAPGGENQLLTRNHLLTGGALDAHFLAELAQNANDAADGKPAAFRARLEDDWLVVANDGRRINARNLFGLSRFFVHLGSETLHALTQKEIGRFGIGFKSCYRIAREVFIESWDAEGSFAFRLPIARDGDPESHAEETRLQRVVAGLRKVGCIVETSDAVPQRFGYCTPEFLSRLPAPVRSLAQKLHRSERGTVFCLHLNRDGASEVRAIFEREDAVADELTPLFTPHLRRVEIGEVVLERTQVRSQADDGADDIEAVKLTLAREMAGSTTNQRMWRLRGTGTDDCWQIALAADSKFQITRADADAVAGSGREGGAFAFFRLGDVKWPLRFHLHIAQPTNLSRGDWTDSKVLDAQIARAMDGMAEWLEKHTHRWHPAWSPADLIEREPEADEERAIQAIACLRTAVRSRKLVRSLAGGFVTGAAARGLEIVDRPDVRDAWRRLGSHPRLAELAPRLAFAKPVLGIKATRETANDCLRLLAEIAGESAIEHPDHVQDAIIAALSIEPPSAPAIERVLAKVQLPRAEGRTIALSELASARRSAHLAPGWHPFFAELLKWNDHRAVGGGTVFGTALSGALDFAEPAFYVDWHELPDFLTTKESWERHGDDFWKDQRAECQPRHAARVLAALRLRDTGGWRAITEFWLHDTRVPTCLDDVLSAHPEASRLVTKLRRWALLDAYDRAVAQRVVSDLPTKLAALFTSSAEGDPLAMLEEGRYANSRIALSPEWQQAVSDAERAAVASFRASHPIPATRKQLISTLLPAPLRSLLLKCEEFQLAPAWLTPLAVSAVARLNPKQPLPTVVFAETLQNAASRSMLAETLLAQAHRWAAQELTTTEIAALDELCRDCNGNTRITLARGTPDFLRNILAIPADAAPAHCNGGEWHWHGRRHLPASLARAPRLVAACLTLADAKRSIEKRGESMPLAEDDVAPELRANPRFVAALAAAGGQANLRYCADFKLVWHRGDEPLCELRNLDFARDGDHLLVSRVLAPPDVSGYADVLATYLRFHRDPAVVRAREQRQGAFAIYEEHRDKILRVFRQQLVERVGYRVEHVLRELLQNAESAYASQREPKPVQRPFLVTIAPGASENMRRVEVAHDGRAFNAIDKDGRERDDTHRIVSLGGERQQAVEELGRFNRGFKSVFNVTRRVQVRSGGYDFSIVDLLILAPPNPTPRDGVFSARTTFAWECPVAQAEELLCWNAKRPVIARVGAFSSAALVFLREVTQVVIRYRENTWSWAIERKAEADGWTRVRVVTVEAGEQTFRVLGANSQRRWVGGARRLAVGFEIDAQGRPKRPAAAPLYLFFPTETTGPCGLWFNGDFEVAEDRLAVRDNSNNAALIKEALALAVEEAQRQIAAQPEAAMWLAWARVLAPQDGREWVQARLSEDTAKLRDGFDIAAAILTAAIPHERRLRRADQLRQPTNFLRRVAAKFAVEWEIDCADWIEPEIGAELDRFAERSGKFWLDDHIKECGARHDLLRRIRETLLSPVFRSEYVRSAIEQQEHDRALNALARFLPRDVEPEPEPASLELADLLEWWEEERDLAPYTLDGDWWPLIFPSTETPERATFLRDVLTRTGDDDARLAWYQVLSIPCLLAIPRPVQRTRTFWQQELAAREFWSRTAAEGFGAWTDQLFAELIARPFDDPRASGEDAEFWRRVFYDMRKIRTLVFENDFADALVDAAVRGIGLADFLHSGSLPDQRRWSGVLGQSASAPVFFLLREMHRLGILAGDMHPPSLFVCRPVRLAAADYGLITPEQAERYDFTALQETDEQIRAALARDPAGRELLRDYDIPLLHWQLAQ